MKLKPEQRVTADVAEARALTLLSRRPVYASEVADVIWPDHSMHRQGAGAAASRILKRLERRGLCRWRDGWVASQSDAFVESAVKVHGALSESQEKQFDAKAEPAHSNACKMRNLARPSSCDSECK